MGNKLLGTSRAYGNFTVTTNHRTNGASGEINSHENVSTFHNSENFIYGPHNDLATSTNGMDCVIYKLSEEGVMEGIYAIDSGTTDGLYYLVRCRTRCLAPDHASAMRLLSLLSPPVRCPR